MEVGDFPPIKTVDIRYTLDGQNPDSIEASPEYSWANLAAKKQGQLKPKYLQKIGLDARG